MYRDEYQNLEGEVSYQLRKKIQVETELTALRVNFVFLFHMHFIPQTIVVLSHRYTQNGQGILSDIFQNYSKILR